MVIMKVDALGAKGTSEEQARKVVEASLKFIREYDFEGDIVLYGDGAEIDSHLPLGLSQIHIEDTPDFFKNYSTPIVKGVEKNLSGREILAFLNTEEARKNSLVRTISNLDSENEFAISSHETSAFAAVSRQLLRPSDKVLKSIKPSFFARMPHSDKSHPLYLTDGGISTNLTSEEVARQGIIASAYFHALHGFKPVTKVLSNGNTDTKGTTFVQGIVSYLKEFDEKNPGFLNFGEGSIQEDAKLINTGQANLYIADAFTGNVSVKSQEAVLAYAKQLGLDFKKGLRDGLKSSNTKIRDLAVIAGLGMAKLAFSGSYFDRAFKEVDPRQYSGGLVIPSKGVFYKNHSSYTVEGLYGSMIAAHEHFKSNVNQKLEEKVQDLIF